jgi:hypothetical protein
MRLGLVPGDVVRVVRGQRRQVQLAGDVEQPVADPTLDVQAVVHQFEEEILGAEDVPEVGRRLQCLRRLAEPQPGLHLTGGAAGRGDDALGVPGDQLAVHPRLVVVALDAGQAGELEQVPQAGGVGREHRHVGVRATAGDVVAALPVAGLPPEDRLLVVPVVRGEVRLDAQHRLDPRRPASPTGPPRRTGA